MPSLNPRSHPYLDLLQPYEPPELAAVARSAGVEPSELLRLGANESQFGPSPLVGQALCRYEEHGFYPEYGRLRRELARYVGVGSDQIVPTNGADEAIDLVIRLLAEPGQTVVICPPTFDMYEFFARVNRCQVTAVRRKGDFSLDVERVEAAVKGSAGGARLLFIASPGNPHGIATPLTDLDRLLDLPVYVVVDQAYIEFGGGDALALLDCHPNLIVIRTFSKWAGLAGIRLGYVIAERGLAALIERVRAPYNVGSAAVVAGLATLVDRDSVRAIVRRVVAERERIHAELAGLDYLEPVAGDGNFILVKVEGMSGSELAQVLAAKGILIQAFSDPALKHYARVTVGRPEQNDAVLSALGGVQSGQIGAAQ